MSLFTELKRRNVFRVVLAYIVVAWLLMQIGDTLAPALRLPEWVMSVLAFFLILGFPLAIVFAWAYELTPDGVRNQKDVDQDRSIAPRTGRKLDYAIIGLLAVGLSYFVWESRYQSDEDPPSVGAVQTTATQSIAVLPFENRSNREEDQFFTDGIHDDLLTTIAKIRSMKVISRTSVMQYRDTTKPISQIGSELGVAHILEGGIQRSGNHVRINVQLIDANSDEHLWAETYDRELTAENIFSIQSEISLTIAAALQATLSTEDEQRVNNIPTTNLEALEAYLRGRQLMASRDSEKLNQAAIQFDKAIELDPNFALAWVGVADSNRLRIRFSQAPREAALKIANAAVERALTIDDKLGEAYASRGLMHWQNQDLENAETALLKAIEFSPNYATGWQWYSAVISNDPSRVDEALNLLTRAAELDPRSGIIGLNLGNAFGFRGLYSQAERQFLKALELDPDFVLGVRTLSYFYMMTQSRYGEAIRYAQRAIELDPDRVGNRFLLASIYLNLDDLAAAKRERERMHEMDTDNSLAKIQLEIEISLRSKDYENTQMAIDSMAVMAANRPGSLSALGFYQLALRDPARARAFYLSANTNWLDADADHDYSDLFSTGCVVAWILLNTGDEEAGQMLLRRTVTLFDDLMRPQIEHIDQHKPEICYLVAGNTEKAFVSLETQLAHGHLYDWFLYHKLPMYDLIRDDPRYTALLEERARKVAVQRELISKKE